MATWKLDSAHSGVTFTVKHMMFAKVHGSFQKLTGELRFDAATPHSATVEASIEAGSIATQEAQRDAHLKGADFFDVEKYPLITFKSKRVSCKGDKLQVVGDLTLHGVTREGTLETEVAASELKDPYGQIRIAASATTRINRRDFGLTWNAALEAGGVLVGEEVQIAIDAAFIKQA